MTLREAQRQFETKFENVWSSSKTYSWMFGHLEVAYRHKTRWSYGVAPTGVRYSTIANGSEHDEGGYKCCSTEESAIHHWLTGILRWSEGKTGTLYWRTEPEIGQMERGWLVYCRLHVSDMPISPNAVEIPESRAWKDKYCPVIEIK